MTIISGQVNLFREAQIQYASHSELTADSEAPEKLLLVASNVCLYYLLGVSLTAVPTFDDLRQLCEEPTELFTFAPSSSGAVQGLTGQSTAERGRPRLFLQRLGLGPSPEYTFVVFVNPARH